MTDDLAPLDAWCAGFIAQLQPAQRRALARRIAADLRRRNQQRIAAQTNPDGTAFEPRKPQLRRKPGALRRRKMFAKLRTARYLKPGATPDEATVAFAAQVQRIARTHQLGLRDRVYRDRAKPTAQYPRRELLGISSEDAARVGDLVLDHLTP